MKAEQLSVVEVLKHSRHDFLNELQLILMNIDLGNPTKARETILQTTEKMKQHSLLFSLNLPKTSIWLTTLEWVHTAFRKSLSCKVKVPITSVDDEELVAYLEKTMETANKFVDAFSDYNVSIYINSSELEWAVVLTFEGQLPRLDYKETKHRTFVSKELYEENLWKFTISER